jgi:CubicO group peptidase (beta-lactamase class C family)
MNGQTEAGMINVDGPQRAGISALWLERIDAAMQKYVDEGKAAGFVTALMCKGQLAHLGCYGQMDIARGIPMREDAIFRIFSMTKPVTSLALLMLLEGGQIALDDPIVQYIPALADLKVMADAAKPEAGLVPLERPITIFDLLTHTSGLGYGLDASSPVEAMFVEAELLRMDEPMEAKIPRIAQIPLHHQPGLRYTYSMATDILGHLVEILSGIPLDEFLRSRIFEPLGMIDTDFYVPEAKVDRLAALYTSLPGSPLMDVAGLDETILPQFLRGLWVRKDEKPRFLSGGGGLVSTTGDYLRFVRMLHGGGALDGFRLVDPAIFKLMITPHLRPDQFFVPGCSAGFGLSVMTDPALAQLPGSAGAFAGGGAASTEFWVDPQDDLIGMLMVQYVGFTPLPISMELKQLMAQAVTGGGEHAR